MNFSKKLIDWYLQNKRSMPWRETRDPYRIWLSEIILQQTRVAQGLPYYLAFTETFPTVYDLAAADEEKVLKLWQGLGYYSRARNLHFTAKYIVANLNGVFPKTYKDLLQLKGVGDYTASAIASICYDEPTPVVDGNVYRVLSRYFNVSTPINTTEGVKEFKAIANEVMDMDEPATYNQAIMEFGAVQCKPKSPYCIVCPLRDSCAGLQMGTVSELPVKLKKLKIKKRYFSYILFDITGEHTVIQKRTGNGIWKNLYEFPFIESDNELNLAQLEHHEAFKKLLGNTKYEIAIYEEDHVVHKLSHQHLYTKFYILKVEQNPSLINDQMIIGFDQILDYPVPILIGNFLDKFLKV